MERVGCAGAVGGGVGQWVDDLQLLDDRARPAVVDDQRQRVLVLRPNVNEMDVEPIDLGDELREGVQPGLARAPVVVGHPVAGELLDHGERHALGLIGDGLFLGPVRGPMRRRRSSKLLLRHIDVEWTDVAGGLDGAAHDDLRRWWGADQRSDRNGRKPAVAAGDLRSGRQQPSCHRALHAVARSRRQQVAVAVRLGGVLDPLGVRHDRAPFAQPTGWSPSMRPTRVRGPHPHRVIRGRVGAQDCWRDDHRTRSWSAGTTLVGACHAGGVGSHGWGSFLWPRRPRWQAVSIRTGPAPTMLGCAGTAVECGIGGVAATWFSGMRANARPARRAGPSSALHDFARRGPTKEAHRRAMNRSDGHQRPNQ